MKQLFLGIDFDGTIVEEGFPEIGAIKPRTVELMKFAKEQGHVVIVWTARSGKYLTEAIDFLNENNIPYDYVNENPEDEYAKRGEQGRKLFCNYYLDDRAVHVDDIEKIFAALQHKPYHQAIIKREFSTGEPYYDEDEFKTFRKGSIVEVVRELESRVKGHRQFIIYSEEINESTVVYDGMIEFI